MNGSGNTAGNVTVIGSGSSFSRVKVLPAWDKNWHHLSVVFSGQTASVYLDGALKGTSTVNAVLNNNASISLGRIPGLTGSFFNGTLDEIRIYNRCLSAPEVFAEYLRDASIPDSAAPAIAITSPVNGAAADKARVVVSGTASDDVGIKRVDIKLDSGDWQAASGTASWSREVNLLLGSNTIYARATDVSGNTAESSINILWDPFAKDVLKEEVRSFPNPYIHGKSPVQKITFPNLPKESVIRIFTIPGDLVKTINHPDTTPGGSELWDVSDVPGGMYMYTITTPEKVSKGKLCIIK